jgi:septal ring factor EnvC (AmiA/AmiB activator)
MTLSIKEITMEQVRQYNPTLYEQIRKSVDPESAISELTEKLDTLESSNQELTEDVEKLKSDLEEMTKERDDLKDKVDKFEAQEKMSEKKDMVTTMITEAKMPKELVSDHFTEQLMKMEEDEIKAAIEDRVAIFDKKKGKVTDSGEEHIQESTSEEEVTEDEVLSAVTR